MTFQRALRLPFPVRQEGVQASFENGVLTITLAKSQAQERSWRIQVQGQQQGSKPEQITQTASGQTSGNAASATNGPGANKSATQELAGARS